MSESEERNKRLMAEAEQIETESREVAEEAWAEVDPRAVQLAADIRSVVEENRRLAGWLDDTLTVLEAPAASSNEAKRELARKIRAALAGKACE